jgi:hypothetical protein
MRWDDGKSFVEPMRVDGWLQDDGSILSRNSAHEGVTYIGRAGSRLTETRQPMGNQ